MIRRADFLEILGEALVAGDKRFDFGYLPVRHLEAKRNHGPHLLAGFAALFVDGSEERHLSGLGIGHEKPVSALGGHRSPEPIARIEPLAVLCKFDVLGERNQFWVVLDHGIEIDDRPSR